MIEQLIERVPKLEPMKKAIENAKLQILVLHVTSL